MRRLTGLRLLVVVLAGATAVGVAISSSLDHHPGSFVRAIPPLLVLVAALFERPRYTETAPPSRLARPTGERFRDPVDGHVTEVCYDPTTGARSYRAVP